MPRLQGIQNRQDFLRRINQYGKNDRVYVGNEAYLLVDSTLQLFHCFFELYHRVGHLVLRDFVQNWCYGDYDGRLSTFLRVAGDFLF